MDLFTVDVTNIPGIGPARAKRLARLQITSVGDVLFYFPARYERVHRESDPLQDGVQAVVEAVVSGSASVKLQGKRSTMSVPMKIGNSNVKALFFNQLYLRHQLIVGRKLRLYGKFHESTQSFMVNRYEVIKPGNRIPEFIPIYKLTKDLTHSAFRGMIQDAMRVYADHVEDSLPMNIRERFKLRSLREAMICAHEPKSEEDIRQAHRRLVFGEFLHFQLQVLGFRRMRSQTQQVTLDEQDLKEKAYSFIEQLPFALTKGQQHAIQTMIPEIASSSPMHRLLQGDVGSGKTAVAFAAIAAVAGLGWQSAYMVPTTILAMQQFEVATSWLVPLGLRVALLIGGQDVSLRQSILADLEAGKLDLVIGTHVLAQEQVHFKNLRLIVTDEQHRFGVTTRKLLRAQGIYPDVLQMTATPIPRTLALTLFGDIAVTSIRELPPGRQPVETKLYSRAQDAAVITLVRTELAKGRQAFMVTPRIDPTEESDMTSAKELYDILGEELAGYTVGLIHGGMPERERTLVMQKFVHGDIAALVATTMIEVGVSVPNATMMVIYDADRFGLATLHQLRGRVGRGAYPGHCILLANKGSDAAQERLQAMLHTQDGFILAQQDLTLRGPGELLGDRQSGMPVFRLGDIVRDMKIMEVARQVASELVHDEEFWLLPNYRSLRKYAYVGNTKDLYVDS